MLLLQTGGADAFAQNCRAGHVVPQAPQCLGSSVVSTQCSLQQTNDPVHAAPPPPQRAPQTPLPQTRPPLHSWSLTQRLQSPFISQTPLAHRDSHVPASSEVASRAPEAVSTALSARFPPSLAPTGASPGTVTSARTSAAPSALVPAASPSAGARPSESEHPTRGTTIESTTALRCPDARMKLPCRT